MKNINLFLIIIEPWVDYAHRTFLRFSAEIEVSFHC